ncbi:MULTISPECIES: glycoside hydrolase family 2 protein [Geobacillus]|jgi:beta-galactosidase/beta-glucuronidase|uniref:Putative hydrolase n=1 Tax=Geobacillus thermodenitrificans (strain NG80-2) TaxID=420246 RepID=A4IKD5_GEOTN|nr:MULTISPECIES: glycoside hydrolase family 2 [Geobacillus]ABO65789.1 Putative hydrolase [Geobacillus thermodenitrificans NG80-2]ARA97762.1 glycoside hydrolase family 2 [Geobacillus thermodenitrificans]MED3718426.1 glycoside hydrolase family 2 [Geobacillus thermodenitrificans]NNU87046.1 glycoside hydrolase family 2 [Geobacillus sp. MR]
MNNVKVYNRTEYPRPQFKRKDWLNLNGKWSFAFDDENIGERNEWYKNLSTSMEIQVPFTYETKASGIGDETFHPVVWYQRSFKIPEDQIGKKVILRFQASDYFTKVWVNGHFVGDHKGGNSAFAFDITNVIDQYGENELVVKVEDSLSCYQPRGKQRWMDKNFGCWYVQTTGIWQTVWLEFLNHQTIKSVKMTPNIDNHSIRFDYDLDVSLHEDLRLETVINFKGREIKRFSINPNRPQFHLEVDLLSEISEWKVFLWSPEDPNLYDVVFRLYDNEQLVDEVESYFGMRKISIKDGKVLLNNKPLYQKLLLDQGYWPDTLLTPPSDEAIIDDINKTIQMGFNGVRKHQKIEDERFLYWCDKKGLLVWSEMAATYEFSDQAVENFTKEWLEIVQQYYNHPSIITWVPFNESWGIPNVAYDKKQQSFTESIYYLTKSIDQMRPVIVNDGWEHTVSDIITLHDYEECGEKFYERYKDKDLILNNQIPHNKDKYAFAEGYTYKGQPVIISEYGGIAFKDEKGWGYGHQVETEDEFLRRYQSITDAIKKLPYISGYCYTQITDVQQEVNGLLKEDRTPKIALEKIKKVNDS